MIAIVDYGVGNLFSLSSSVRSLGAEVRVTRDAADLRAADHILLPGVGAFADAMAKLEATGLVPVLREESQKKPLLGICLGMQLLFEKSCEYGEHRGLGLIPGEVCPLADDLTDPALKVPHIGWNAMDIVPGREADPHAHPALPVVLQSGDGRAVVVLAKAWSLRAGIGAQVEPVGGVGVVDVHARKGAEGHEGAQRRQQDDRKPFHSHEKPSPFR